MVAISFSFIPDAESDVTAMKLLLKRFEEQSGQHVNLVEMTWDDAWNELLDISLRGRGPEVSMTGSTWISSLMAMGALRPFSTSELTAIGRANAFLGPAWQSVLMADDDQVWTIPFTSFFYVIVHRRDCFEKIGFSAEEVFSSSHLLAETARRFKGAGMQYPWLASSIPFNMPPPHMDLLHVAAGMIWSAGGEIVGPSGRHMMVHQPAAKEGIKRFLEIDLQLDVVGDDLDMDLSLEELKRTNTAALIMDARTAWGLEERLKAQGMIDQVGVIPLSKVTWFGGENLVIWRHARTTPEIEKAAVDLTIFLAGRESQTFFARQAMALPARLASMEEVFPPDHLMGSTFRLVAQHGRAYPSISLWRRIEFQLAETLNEVRQEYRRNPRIDLDALLDKHLIPLSRRLDLTLS